MSEHSFDINDSDFFPPLPEEEEEGPPPLPPSPPPQLTNETPPPLPVDSPPESPSPPSEATSDVAERPPLPTSPPASPRSPSPPLLEAEKPVQIPPESQIFKSTTVLSPITVHTNLDFPVCSPLSSLSHQSSLSRESKSHSYIEPTSPWQLAASDTYSIMSDFSDSESIEDGEIISLPDLDDKPDMPPLPDHPDDEAPPPLPNVPHPAESPSEHMLQVQENGLCQKTSEIIGNPAHEAGELKDSDAEEANLETGDAEQFISSTPGTKRSPEDPLGLESDAKKQKLDDDMDDNASSVAEPPPSIASHQSSMQEFHILDDAQWDIDDDQDDDGGNDSDSSMDYEEIDALLDSGVADPKPREPLPEGEEPLIKDKVILIEKGQNPFEVLPEGWIVVTHNSGMPVYLHKDSRVCTLSRPYFLGPGSIRKHDIPVSSIPCLQYRKELEKEKNPEEAENVETKEEDSIEKITSQVRIESAAEKTQETSLNPDVVRDYCQNLFQFKTITVHRFKTWKDRRRHQHKQRKTSRPMLPSDTKLITCPILARDNESEEKPNRKKGFVLNPAGKSSIGILHEYMQHSMRLQPQYEFKELDNASTPYSATVIINKMAYGTGYATSKKAAKVEAAKATLDILIPQLKKATPSEETDPLVETHKDLSFFDELKIEDPRVADLCNRAGQPSPYQILLECLKRNFVGDASLQMDMKTLKRQTGQFSMSVGSHSTTVTCKNKREGKQLAAQSILQLIHPHITCWGSLLRLYGTHSHRALKQFQESITKLQSKERSNGPNLAILAKLKKEMLKLRERKAAVVPIGTMKIRSAELPSPTPVSIIKL